MKTAFRSLPPWTKTLLYFMILWAATLIAGAVPFLNDLTFFLAIALVTSWIFLKFENAGLRSLRCWPENKKDIYQFLHGLTSGALMLVSTAALTLAFTEDQWILNEHIDPVYILMTFISCLWSVYVQEFVFRGYPFQILLQKYSPWFAQLIIAIPFGLMHIHQGMNTSNILITMLSTGAGSLLFGLAYLKTKNLMLPIGIHLGWNFLQSLIPRVADGNNSGLIIITDNQNTYGTVTIVVPYFIVVSAAFVLVYYYYPANNSFEPDKISQ